jgi:hypothetical protein
MTTPANYLELFDDARFPAMKTELIEHAEMRDASNEVLTVLQAMPDERITDIEDLNRNILKVDELPGKRENVFASLLNRKEAA